LPAIVIDHPVTMAAAVVFDREALLGVEEVWTAQETALIVVDRYLNFRLRESRQHEQHPQASLHRGLGLRLRQVNNTPKPSDTLDSRMLGDIRAQFVHRHQPGMKEHVRCDDTFCQRISASEVDDRTERRCGRQTATPHDFLASEGAAAN
jgi:hypothetical protein